MSKTEKKNRLIPYLLIALTALLRLWGLGVLGVQSDAALNAVRAMGWLDFLSGSGQTSPIVWFGQIPWWGILSFHDGPPLVFLIERFFIFLFGDSSFVVLLPFALAGIGIAALLYFLLERLGDRKTAVASLLIFAISTNPTWLARTGYLEGIETFFLAVTFACLLLYHQTRQAKWLWGWSISVGLSLLSKYTAIFALPAAAIYFLTFDKAALKSKQFWLSCAAIPIILLPVIVYNFEVFQTRGHFDAALSSMVGMHPQDFSTIASRGVNSAFWENIPSVFNSLGGVTSLPFWFFEILVFIAATVILFRRVTPVFFKLAYTYTCFIVLEFCFAGGQERFLSIITPFLAVVSGYVLVQLGDLLRQKTRVVFYWLAAALALLLGWEFLFNLNTNLFRVPFGQPGIAYSRYRFYDNGFAEIDSYLQENLLTPQPAKRELKTYDDLQVQSFIGKNVLLFDSRGDWFSSMWHVQRHIFYFKSPIVPFLDFLELTHTHEDPFAYMREAGVENFYLAVAQPAGISGGLTVDSQYLTGLNEIVDILKEAHIVPVEIRNARGEVVYKIYKFQIRA